MKQTAQEKAKELCEVWGMEDNHGYSVQDTFQAGFVQGANWQAEQSMSQEQVDMKIVEHIKSIEMESITDNNYISGRLLTRQGRIKSIRDHIERDNEELTRVSKRMEARDAPLEEWLRLSDIRNNLTVSIHRKEEELSRLTDSRRLDQPKRVNYNY